MENLIKRLYCTGTHSYSYITPDGCNTAMLGLFVMALYPLGLGSQKVPATEVKTSISKFTQQLNESPRTINYGVYTCCNRYHTTTKIQRNIRPDPFGGQGASQAAHGGTSKEVRYRRSKGSRCESNLRYDVTKIMPF
jgi:hypothetical protein